MNSSTTQKQKTLTILKGLQFPGYFVLTVVLVNLFYSGPSRKEKEHPGFFNQWFNEKKNSDGIIPAFMRQKWAAWDRQNGLLTNRADNPIETVTQLGPNTTGGRTRALWIHPTNENIILAGGISGGMWRSTNKGVSWTAVNDQEVSLMPSCIASNPLNPNTIIYGTGESRANSADVDGNGIYMSVDGGKSFKVLSSTSNKAAFNSIWDIKYSLDDTNVIFAATNSSGLLRSDDNGQSWSAALSVSGAKQINHIVVMPGGRILCAAYGNTVYYSDQNGAAGTFVAINAFPNKPAAGLYGRIQIAECKKFPNVVYALYSNVTFSGTPLAFYKSSDYGQTWKSTTVPTNIGASYQNYTLMLGVNANDSTKIVAGGVNVMRSNNSGSTWFDVTEGHSDNHTFVPILTKPDEFLIGSDGGVHLYKWSSTGTPTSLNTSYVTTQFYAGGYGPTGLITIAGTQDNGTHVTTGALASTKAFGADGAYAHIGLQTGFVAYLSTQNEGIRRIDNFVAATPGGSVSISDAAFTTDGVDFINSYMMNPADETQLYYRTTRGLYRSTTSGETWDFIIQRGNIKAIAVEAKEDPIVYCGGNGSALYRLTNAASSTGTAKDKVFTSQVPSSVAGSFINCIDINPKDNNTVLIAFSNNSNAGRVWKATGFAQNSLKWTNISGNLPVGLPVNYVAQDPSRPMEMMFAGTDFGLYYTADSGKTWAKETRIPNVAVFEVKMRADRTLFAFTHGRGIFALKLSDASQGSASVKQNVANTNVLKLFPNPAVNQINVELPQILGTAETNIYNISGQVVKTVYLKGGKNTIAVGSLSAGAYYIRSKFNGKAITQKFYITN